MSIKIAFFVFIFMFISINKNCTEDYYKLIGVKRTATHQGIKKAFKKLLLKYEDDEVILILRIRILKINLIQLLEAKIIFSQELVISVV